MSDIIYEVIFCTKYLLTRSVTVFGELLFYELY